jgi:hypothetical protein
MRVLHKLDIRLNFSNSFFLKDCSLNFLFNNLDQGIVKQLQEISKILPQKRHITFDIGFLKLKEGDKTCRDVGWHVDGVDNDYLIYCQGDFRTQFLNKELDVKYPEHRSELRQFNESIASTEIDVAGNEIPDSTLVQYSSKDIHRGRLATSVGERFFLRVCSSDYLVPKNFRMI